MDGPLGFMLGNLELTNLTAIALGSITVIALAALILGLSGTASK